MPQQSVRAVKQTKVQKLLQGDESLRHSVELSWQQEKASSEGLEVLARCKALNEFIRKVGWGGGTVVAVLQDSPPLSATYLFGPMS